MLKLAGETDSGAREKIETIIYSPGVKGTGDLEAGTKTIITTSEASGLGNADYSEAVTLPKPDDARLEIKRIAARLQVTIDSFDTATHLYCRVYVDSQDADHRLFDMDWDSIGDKLAVVDKTAGTIFDLLSDGESHTFYFFFWIDQANNAVISYVAVWEMVGSSVSDGNRYPILTLTFDGLVEFITRGTRTGTGTDGIVLHIGIQTGNMRPIPSLDGATLNFGSYMICGSKLALVGDATWGAYSVNAGDIAGIDNVRLLLRSEQ